MSENDEEKTIDVRKKSNTQLLIKHIKIKMWIEEPLYDEPIVM
jgi:hypothetical protein